MCRFAAHLGDPVPLSALLYDPPHALEEMAWRPRELQHGTMNVDGTGLAWWDDHEPGPARYVTVSPPWSDANLPSLARRITSGVIIGAVRGATPGIAYGPGNVAPYVADGLAFAHNGWLGGFRQGVRRHLEEQLSDEVFHLSAAVSDSITLFQVLIEHHRQSGDLVAAAAATVRSAQLACAQFGADATLNLLVSDGQRVVATKAHLGLRGNSLYTAQDALGLWLASEAMDEVREWRSVPEDHLVVLDDDGVTLLELSAAERP